MAVTVRYADGSEAELPDHSTAADALRAKNLLGREVIAAKVNGEVVDLSRTLPAEAQLEPIFADSREGLEVLRHSSAHLMAQAVKRLFPETQVTIGPVIENGFYYDFARPEPFAQEDLERIEAEMAEIVRANYSVEREEWPKEKAIQFFRDLGERYKVEIIEAIPEPVVSVYRQGEFLDLCRGPHVPSTGAIRAVKLTHLAGAYWRGDARNEMLQRIYGTAWANEAQLKEYLEKLEQARQRDHRRLGQQLDLFSLHPIAPGSPFFHPKGTVIYNELVQFIRGLYRRYGYTEVITPLIYKTELWKTSGHYEAFHDDMFLMKVEEEEYGVKPMNCPGHCYLYAARKYSYRDLPIRFADFSRLHRFEPSGTLTGLTRVRSMAQDDAHIFCTPEQMDEELDRFVAMTREVYDAFGFEEIRVSVQTRPEKFLGRPELWEQAEAALERVARETGYPVMVLPGEGAFYGPKIGFDVHDVLGRTWTLATVQIDCAMPERFGLEYITSAGTAATPVMLHRAVLGSLERFIAMLLEHTGGELPLWLAPVQVRVLTLTERQAVYGRQVADRLSADGFRVELDDRNEKLGYKIREGQLEKIPYLLVVGDREASDHKVAPRSRARGVEPTVTLEEFAERLRDEVAKAMKGPLH